MTNLIRHTLALAAAVTLIAQSGTRAATVLPPVAPQAFYILPLYPIAIPSESSANFAAQVQQLRTRIGEGPRARVGFTTYLFISMDWTVDPGNAAAVRASLAPLIAQIDDVIAKARTNAIPVCISFLTAIRADVDPAQAASQAEDRRVMQWHSDNSLAAGWWTYSRYARKQIRLREAYIREVGRVVANRMALYPSTLVAATGDGEIELSSERGQAFLADYSPFAVAEFRDWLRAGGQYASGQPHAADAYALAARYAGDASPSFDTNGDGHTLNGDFGTSFTTWDLRHFDWKLTDPIDGDPGAIPASVAAAPDWNPLPSAVPSGFDAPRNIQRGTPWWDTWDLFRATMVRHYNRDFAQWITTTPDNVSGSTVPTDRWFSDQIPADYLFGGTPQNPNERLFTSASPLSTADTSPYGSIGVTSFNINFGPGIGYRNTLVNVAPAIAALNRPWAITEWNPSLNADPSFGPAPIEVYRAEMALIEQYRPRVVIPFVWGRADYPIENTGFETALRELVARIKDGVPADTRVTIESPGTSGPFQQPFTLSGWALDLGTIRGPGWGTGVDVVRVQAYRNPGPNVEAPIDLDAVAYGTSRGDLAATFGAQFTKSGFSIAVNRLPVGTFDLVVSARSVVTGTFSASQTIRVTIAPPPGVGAAPFGVFDTPTEGAIVAGEVPVTGWALDDRGIAAIEVYRNAVPGEASSNGLVFIGAATRVGGARPDIAGVYPTLVDNDRAGWGLMVLSNMLPNGGTGVFTLSAYAKDLDGLSTLLGTRRIDARNATSRTPFGTIDTPGQGATISGIYVNFGWALTPQPNGIPLDGSTIDIYIDSLPVGHPVYNVFRPDIANLFPGLANSNGAIGYFVIDTTTLANGVHTIAWVARDSAGNATGMGSRFFTVAN